MAVVNDIEYNRSREGGKEMNNQQSWERIVEEYPDKWVALSDYSMDGPTVITAVVRAVCSDNERLSKEKELDAQNMPFIWRRTTEIEGAYVL